MLETIASYLSGIWILLMLIAAIIKSPVLIGVFMCLYVVSMALWGISWLNKKYDVKRKMAAAKKTAKPEEQTVSQETQQSAPPPAEPESETLLTVNNANGRLTVSIRKSANDYSIACSAADGTAYHFTAIQAQYTSSGLRFVLEQKGWPEWVTDELANWKGIWRITRDTAAPDTPDKIFWENDGDPSRLHSILWFEKVNDQWSLGYTGSDLPALTYPLPEATDENIAEYLQLNPKAFWQHPAIRELHWVHTAKTPPPAPKNEPKQTKAATPAPKPQASKPVGFSKQQLVHHTMSAEEQHKCDLMLKKLDEDLKSVNTDRSFLDLRHYGNGKPRFGYAEEYGYYVVIQPERANEIVPFAEKDESDFRRIMLREAAECGCGTGLFLTLTYNWGARAEHGEEKLEVSYREKAFQFVLTSTYWNDAGPGDPPRVTTKLLRTAKRSDFLRFTLSGFLFHMETMHGLPGWAIGGLKREKVFTSLFHPSTVTEDERCIYWINAGNQQEKWVVWFEQRNGTWHACANVRTPEVRIDKTTPLPRAGHRDIASLLCLDPFIYIHQPDIENWCLEDLSARVTLFNKASSPCPGERLTVQFAIDRRNGALYRTEAHTKYADGDRGPVVADSMTTIRPSFFQELISQDIQFRGMTLKNWRNYLPKDNKSARSQSKSALTEALETFTPEKRKQFDERIYQYHQDVQRGGTPPEIAAASRYVVLIDGRPIPKEAAERMKEQETKKKASKTVSVYTHKRRSFYDEESSVVLDGSSVLVRWDTPNMADHTTYPLPAFMQEAGFTRGGLLTWLKSQGCAISFPKEDLTDVTVLRPHAVLMMREELPVPGFGKKIEAIDVHFYTGSNCLSSAAVYGMKDGTEWLLSSSEWRDEHDPQYDTSMECAIRHIHKGSMTERNKAALKHMAQRIPTLWQARQFASLRLYHADIPLTEYGEVVKELYDWVSSVGHDSQSWDCRVHTTTLRKKNDAHYVIDRTLWIDGTTQEHRWVTTVAQLKPGQEETITADNFHESIARLPYSNPAAW